MHSLGAARRQSREREAFVWQQHPRALTGIQEELCMPGEKSRFPNSFYPLSAETTHGRAAAPQLQPVTLAHCAHPSGYPTELHPCLGNLPPKHDTTNTLSQLSGWSEGNYLMHSWSRSFPSPSSGRPWPETGWEYSVFHPCAHVLPLVVATDAATRTPEEPLATHSSSDLRAKPAQGLPLAAFPRRLIWSPEAKLASSHPAMNPN